MDLLATGAASNNVQDQLTVVQILVPILLGLLAGIGGAWATLARYREKVDQLEKIDCQKRLSSLEGSFNAVQGQVNALQQNSPTNYLQAHSPTSLTENGKQLLKDSGIEKYVDDKFTDLLAATQAKLAPKGDDYSAYDVQIETLQVIREHADDKDFIPVKDFAFSKGIDLNNIQLVGGVYLRDKCLESLGFDVQAYYSSDDDGHAHKRKKTGSNE